MALMAEDEYDEYLAELYSIANEGELRHLTKTEIAEAFRTVAETFQTDHQGWA